MDKIEALLLSWNPENLDWNYKEAYLKVKNVLTPKSWTN